jgi:hypothetical protein
MDSVLSQDGKRYALSMQYRLPLQHPELSNENPSFKTVNLLHTGSRKSIGHRPGPPPILFGKQILLRI